MRLRYAYIIKCTGVTKDPATGAITELHCTYDPETKSGMPQADRKVKGTIHWVSAEQAVTAPVRLYDHLFSQPDPDEVPAGQTYLVNLNPKSLEVLSDCRLEPSLGAAKAGEHFQFERNGYFIADVDRFQTWQTGFQSDGDAERHLGEDRTEGRRTVEFFVAGAGVLFAFTADRGQQFAHFAGGVSISLLACFVDSAAAPRALRKSAPVSPTVAPP